jgi:hypothetical protein
MPARGKQDEVDGSGTMAGAEVAGIRKDDGDSKTGSPTGEWSLRAEIAEARRELLKLQLGKRGIQWKHSEIHNASPG